MNADARAQVLTEALPYIRRFWGKVVVVKYGGNALHDASIGDARRGDPLDVFARDIVLMRSVGMQPVVVHGGGPQIGALLDRLGMVAEFRDGLRVTDAATLDVVRMVLVGKVNRDVVCAINVHAPIAVGVSGEDGGFLRARARHADLGFVGDITAVDTALIDKLLADELIPVVATIGTGTDGQAYNITADSAAAAIAVALGAEKLIHLTNVEGVRRVPGDPASHAGALTADELDGLLATGAIEGGMRPKAESCLTAVRAGVAHAHILDGRVPHVLLLELFTQGGIGTMVTLP